MDEIRCTLSTTVLGCVDEFMGYIPDYYHLNGFVSDSVSRNTFGIEKAYYYELRKCTLSSDVVAYEVTPTRV